jgi:hypothetical protein
MTPFHWPSNAAGKKTGNRYLHMLQKIFNYWEDIDKNKFLYNK